MAWTNRGKARLLGAFFRKEEVPDNLYIALITNADTPDADTNVFSELTEIAAGSGYVSGGYELDLNNIDFDTLTENDSDDYAAVIIKDVVWLADGGSIPEEGDGAIGAVLLDDNIVVADRDVLAFWSLGEERSAADGQTLTLRDLTLALVEPGLP